MYLFVYDRIVHIYCLGRSLPSMTTVVVVVVTAIVYQKRNACCSRNSVGYN